VAKGLQVRRRVGECFFRAAGGPRGFRRSAQTLDRPSECIGVNGQRRHGVGASDRRADLAREQLEPCAALHHDLAAEQVERLNAVRALVDHVEAVVTPVLLDRKITRVAVAAQHLNGQAVGLQAPLARPALGNRREHFEQQARFGDGLRRAGRLLVDELCAIQLERERAFAIALLREQHAPHVGVLNDRHLRLGDVFAADAHRPALRPVLRIVQRHLVARVPEHRRAESDRDARLVHHVEHAAQAFVRLADEVAHGAGPGAVEATARATAHRVLAFAEVQQRVRDAPVAELVVQTGERHIVALAGQLPIDADEFFRHDEQRDAARACDQLAVGPGNLREHQVNDVFGQLVLAVADPHLVAAQPVARAERVGLEIVAIGRGACDHVREAGAGLRLA